MNVALRKPRMTREEFFLWAEAQDERYEFDGFEPVPMNTVAMTGGTPQHNLIALGIHRALHTRLRGSPCRPFGMDAGVKTLGDTVRYPDALVTCTKVLSEARLIPNPVLVFEVLSPASSRMDRIVKLREYRAVPSIRRYVILEHTSADLTSFERADGEGSWTATTLTADDVLHMPEIGIEVPVSEFYEDVELPKAEGSVPA